MSQTKPLVSYIVPTFNEAAIIAGNLGELYRHVSALEPKHPYEIIVVNDGSADESGATAEAFARSHPNVTVVHHLRNQGLSAALQTGFHHARGDLVVTLDVDLSYAPYHINLMLRALEQTNAAMVLTSPYMRGGMVVNVPWTRKILSAWANRYLSVATGGQLATLTGMVRAYNAAALRKLNVSAAHMDFNYEVVFAALRLGLPVLEIPARLQWRSAPTGASLRRSSMKVVSHSWSVMMAGLRFRPSMIFVLPALVPGIWPLLAASLAFFHSSRTIAIEATMITLAVQLASMAFLGVLTGSYITRLRRKPPATLPLQTGSRTESSA